MGVQIVLEPPLAVMTGAGLGVCNWYSLLSSIVVSKRRNNSDVWFSYMHIFCSVVHMYE